MLTKQACGILNVIKEGLELGLTEVKDAEEKIEVAFTQKQAHEAIDAIKHFILDWTVISEMTAREVRRELNG